MRVLGGKAPSTISQTNRFASSRTSRSVAISTLSRPHRPKRVAWEEVRWRSESLRGLEQEAGEGSNSPFRNAKDEVRPSLIQSVGWLSPGRRLVGEQCQNPPRQCIGPANVIVTSLKLEVVHPVIPRFENVPKVSN